MVSHPAIDRATRCLDAQVAAAQNGSGQLPSLNVLAQTAGVSLNTMWKAAGALKRAGILDIVPGGAIRVASMTPGPVQPKMALWQRKQAIVAQDLVNGRLADRGDFPTIKEIQVRYGICFVTAQKIVRSLCDNGLIVPYRKTFRFAGLKRRRPQRSIVVVREQAPYHWVAGERGQKIVSAAEALGASMGFAVQAIAFDGRDPRKVASLIDRLGDRPDRCGIIVDLWFMGPPERLGSLASLVERVCRPGLPVAILDHVGSFPVARLAPFRCAHLFRPANVKAGRAMGNLLLAQGHTNVRFVSLWHGYRWSQDRLAGIAASFRAAGFASGVTTDVQDALQGGSQFVFDLLNYSEETFRKVFGPSLHAGDLETLLERYRAGDFMRARHLQITAPERSSYRAELDLVVGLLRTKIRPETFVRLRDTIVQSVEGRLHVAFERKFLNAITLDPPVTALVCANDGTALVALHLLQEKGIKIPGTICLAGFDNAAASQEESLTSYDFDIAALTHRMVHFVQHPGQWPHDIDSGPTEVEGYVVERRTTRQQTPF